MRTIGIVCEYNPFHKGHLFHLSESRRLAGEDAAVVCIMSGDYVQRGEAAFFDKFARAEAACRCGADLVLELPLPWCLRSAEGFAAGSVELLAALGCDALSFGSECGEPAVLRRLAALSLRPETQEQIRSLMRQEASLSYPRARLLVLEKALGPQARLLTEPNNILGVEYCKALLQKGAEMEVISIRRRGAGHDSESESPSGEAFCSAMQLRRMLEEKRDIGAFVPEEAAAVFQREILAGRCRNQAALELLLQSRLYELNEEGFDELPDAADGTGRRVHQILRQGKTLEECAKSAATKRFPASRIRRMLLCGALHIRAGDAEGTPPYLRLLAANERGRALLREKAEKSPVPLLTKPADVRRLGERATRIFMQGSDAHDLYCLQFAANHDKKRGEDWKKSPILV